MADSLERFRPGAVRDAILDVMASSNGESLNLIEIQLAVDGRLGGVPHSSIRSFLNNHTPALFERSQRGFYRLRSIDKPAGQRTFSPYFKIGLTDFFLCDCFELIRSLDANSIHAVVTDPPYGLVEYSDIEKTKLRNGKGGVWRIPPSFDGNTRSPLPRFTVLKTQELNELRSFFERWARLVVRVLVPGGNVIVASNPLLHHHLTSALASAGLEPRGAIVRQVMTMRGGDRPKNAHKEFDQVSVMPRSMWEPWVVARKPLDGRAQDNLRKWRTGGFKRPGPDKPFGDLIKSSPTPKSERNIANHPSLKPQDFMRQIVRASLPLGEGVVFDPFAGSGSTLAAANFCGYRSIGAEIDREYANLACQAIPLLGQL